MVHSMNFRTSKQKFYRKLFLMGGVTLGERPENVNDGKVDFFSCFRERTTAAVMPARPRGKLGKSSPARVISSMRARDPPLATPS
jgi:hypothetical protein